MLAETGLLALIGAGLGLIFAYGGLDLLVGLAERFTPRASEISIDGGVLLFTLVTACAAALFFAYAPSLRSPEEGGSLLLRTGSRASGAGQRLQRGLIVAQVAAAVTVLTAAGLLTRTLLSLNSVDTGVDVTSTLTMQVPDDGAGRSPEETLRLQEQMRDRIAELPGVTAVGVGLNVPLVSSPVLLEVRAEARPPEPGVPAPIAEYRTATPEYFDAAGMRVLSGRGFADTDVSDGAPVAVLNETLAARLFADEDPIGRRVAWTGDVLQFIGMSGRWMTVVGIVNDTRDGGPSEAPGPALYQPLAQNDLAYFPGAFVIRAEGADALAPQAERVVRELAPENPVERVATLEQIREESVASQRLNAWLVTLFGGLALVIAAIGIAGVLAFFVAQRTTEIGIRMSLGADRARVLGMVLSDGGILLALGVGLGFAASALVARLLEGLLFGVTPGDPATFLAVALVTVAVGLGACALPARRAAGVDPLVAMREE
jgi:predicted permease